MSKMHSNDNIADDTHMMSANSPYQPTTQPLPNRKQVLCLTLDLAYIKSKYGTLSLVIIGLSLLTMILSSVASGYRYGHGCTVFISTYTFISTIIIVVVYAFRFYETLSCIAWQPTILLNNTFSSLVLLIGASVSASHSRGSPVSVATTLFAFMTTGVMMFKTYLEALKFRQSRNQRARPSTVAHVETA